MKLNQSRATFAAWISCFQGVAAHCRLVQDILIYHLCLHRKSLANGRCPVCDDRLENRHRYPPKRWSLGVKR